MQVWHHRLLPSHSASRLDPGVHPPTKRSTTGSIVAVTRSLYFPTISLTPSGASNIHIPNATTNTVRAPRRRYFTTRPNTISPTTTVTNNSVEDNPSRFCTCSNRGCSIGPAYPSGQRRSRAGPLQVLSSWPQVNQEPPGGQVRQPSASCTPRTATTTPHHHSDLLVKAP